MDSQNGGQQSFDRQRQTAAEIARKKVLAAFASATPKSESISKLQRDLGHVADEMTPSYKQAPIRADVAKDKDNAEEWKKYHSAWQDYYQKYYSEYYSKAAKTYLEGEQNKTAEAEKLRSENEKLSGKLKAMREKHDQLVLNATNVAVDPTDEEEQDIMSALKATVKKHAKIEVEKARRRKRLMPFIAGAVAVLLILFLQYNRLIFAPIAAYVSPGNSSDDGITALDPTLTTAISGDSRLLIPKLNVDVPINFGISNDTASINAAMENGVAQFAIPGANAYPGEIGNLVISGHSAGDIYSNNQYKFIFSGLERLELNDLIYIDYEGTRYTYTVVKFETVEPDNVAALVYDTDKPMLTLLTCTPLGTSRYRLLVTAEQISPTPSGATQSEYVDDGSANAAATESMPENEPTFFERIWNWLTGNS